MSVGHADAGVGCALPAGGAHPIEHFLMRDDRRARTDGLDCSAKLRAARKKPVVAIFSLPPMRSGAALVLMM